MRILIKECKNLKEGTKCRNCWQNVGDVKVICMKKLEKYCKNN